MLSFILWSTSLADKVSLKELSERESLIWTAGTILSFLEVAEDIPKSYIVVADVLFEGLMNLFFGVELSL